MICVHPWFLSFEPEGFSLRLPHTMGCELKRERVWSDIVPFGIGREKPQHFRDMLRVAWANRDNLGYAWKVLTLILA